MYRLICFLMGLLVLNGCQKVGHAHSQYQNKLAHTIGKSASSLYSYWGQPQQMIPVADDTYLAVYFASESQPIDNDYHPYESEISYAAMAVPNDGLPTPPPLFYCKTTFVIRNNIVVDANFNGDDCR